MNILPDAPLLSVCIQTFQHKEFIGKCLDSILSQKTDFEFEIILGEDDSTDGTREICIQYVKKYPGLIRLFLRSEVDKIYVFGCKTGRFNFISNLRAARGKYIALIDGDDYIIDERKFQKQVDFLENNKELSCCFHQVFREEKRKEFQGKRCEKLYVSTEPFLPDKPSIFTFEDELQKNLIQMSSSMLLRSNIDPIPEWFWEVPMIDYPLHIHNSTKGNIGYLPDPMVVYVLHDQSMWSSKPPPFQYIKHWQLFTIMARNFEGEIRTALIRKRYEAGKDLVKFYRDHIWESPEWFEVELSSDFFPGDKELNQLLHMPISMNNYIRNGIRYSKKILKSLKRL